LRTLALALSLLLPSAATAHDLWIERDGGAFVLRYGHRGGQPLPLERAKLTSLRCADGQGGVRELLPQATFLPTEVRVTASCAALSASYPGGYWSLTPDGERNLPRDQVPDAVRSWESREFAKWVSAAAAARPLGDELELVAASALAGVRPGDKLTWRVLLAGRPVAGAVVGLDHRAIGETDSAGEVRIKVREGRLQVLDASFRRAVRTPQADSQVFQASIAFEVAP
jgi:nickel transport protein